MGEIWILLESSRLRFMKCSADDLLLHGKSSACGFTRRGANVTAYYCWKERIFVPFSDPHFCLFSHRAQQSWSLLHELWFLLDTLASFCLTEPAKNNAFAEEMWLRVTFLPSEVSCWISGGCDQEAVVSATSLLAHRLTAETVQLLAESPKNLCQEVENNWWALVSLGA